MVVLLMFMGLVLVVLFLTAALSVYIQALLFAIPVMFIKLGWGLWRERRLNQRDLVEEARVSAFAQVEQDRLERERWRYGR